MTIWSIAALLHVDIASMNSLCRPKEGTETCSILDALSIGEYLLISVTYTYTAVNIDEEELLVTGCLDIP